MSGTYTNNGQQYMLSSQEPDVVQTFTYFESQAFTSGWARMWATYAMQEAPLQQQTLQAIKDVMRVQIQAIPDLSRYLHSGINDKLLSSEGCGSPSGKARAATILTLLACVDRQKYGLYTMPCTTDHLMKTAAELNPNVTAAVLIQLQAQGNLTPDHAIELYEPIQDQLQNTNLQQVCHDHLYDAFRQWQWKTTLFHHTDLTSSTQWMLHERFVNLTFKFVMAVIASILFTTTTLVPCLVMTASAILTALGLPLALPLTITTLTLVTLAPFSFVTTPVLLTMAVSLCCILPACALLALGVVYGPIAAYEVLASIDSFVTSCLHYLMNVQTRPAQVQDLDVNMIEFIDANDRLASGAAVCLPAPAPTYCNDHSFFQYEPALEPPPTYTNDYSVFIDASA